MWFPINFLSVMTTVSFLAQNVPIQPTAEPQPPADERASFLEEIPSTLTWHDDYGQAYVKARREKRMLLINFVPPSTSALQQELDQAIAAHADWQPKLRALVLARLPHHAETTSGGKQVRLLAHPAFAEMHGRPGIAVLDLAHADTGYYGRVVSAFPFMNGKYYRWRAEHLPVVLDLPPGTITQRTMVWAVRVHPERPASTGGLMDVHLADAAQQHCQHQARIGLQGHHRWAGRFHRLRALLGGGAPVEVVAESWPGQNMVDSCIDCVASWRHSSGHWSAVRGRHRRYGYDIRRGGNGIWYGTGIFASH